MKFGSSPLEQSKAHAIVSAMRDGHLDRAAGKPLFEGKDGKPIYRILLRGLRPWVKYDLSAYSAQDGPDRQFNVGLCGRRVWGCVLHDSAKKGRPTKVVIVAEGLATMRDARMAAEEYARRLKWVEGAPW